MSNPRFPFSPAPLLFFGHEYGKQKAGALTPASLFLAPQEGLEPPT